MRVIKFELYRAFHSKTFIISILIGVLICVLDIITFCIEFGTSGDKYLIQAWIGTDYQFAYNEMFYVLLPVIACLPYGGSLFWDIKTGYDKNICMKASRSSYAFAKSLSVFLSAFVCVAFPLGVNLFVVAGLFPNYIPERLEFMSIGLLDRHLFTSIYSYHPAVYCLIYILVDGMFAGAVALISLSLSKVVKSDFSAVVAPMVIAIISSMILSGDDQGNWGFLGMINPRQYVTTLWYQMLFLYIGILTINIVIIGLISRKRDVI